MQCVDMSAREKELLAKLQGSHQQVQVHATTSVEGVGQPAGAWIPAQNNTRAQQKENKTRVSWLARML